MLLDSNVVSNFLKPRRSAELVAFVNGAIAEGNLTIAAVTVFELQRGVEELVLKGQGRRKLVNLHKFLDRCEILDLENGGWEFAAKLWARGRARKPAIVFTDADLLIVATAAFHGRRFATCERTLVENLAAIDIHDVELVPNG